MLQQCGRRKNAGSAFIAMHDFLVPLSSKSSSVTGIFNNRVTFSTNIALKHNRSALFSSYRHQFAVSHAPPSKRILFNSMSTQPQSDAVKDSSNQ